MQWSYICILQVLKHFENLYTKILPCIGSIQTISVYTTEHKINYGETITVEHVASFNEKKTVTVQYVVVIIHKVETAQTLVF